MLAHAAAAGDRTMRRPHVYERSATRVARGRRAEPVEDYGPAVRATLAVVPDLLRQAEAAGAVTLARFLGQALTEAEGIVRRGEVLPRK